jgi:hypothetical protein
MIRNFVPRCGTDRDAFAVDDSLQIELDRVLRLSGQSAVDFFCIAQICKTIGSSRDEQYLQQVIHQVTGALEKGARQISRATSQADMIVAIQCFDALLSSLLRNPSVRILADKSYVEFLLKIGKQVLYPLIHGFSSFQLIKRFNCETLVSDCYRGWRDSLDANVWDHISAASREWRYLDKVLYKIADNSSLTELGNQDVYDFHPVMSRTSICAKPDSRVISRAHSSFFRYLVSNCEFSRHIVTLVSKSDRVNESNMTVTNNTPGRRGSVDSMASADFTSKPLNDPMEMFSLHCVSFLSSFGAGILAQIANDLLTALRNPPSDFLRLVLSLSPSEASNEGHQAIKKYLSLQLLNALRSMVRNRSDHTAAEDGCLSFLMKAEMSSGGSKRQEYRVVSAIVDCVLDFTVNELCSDTQNRNRFFGIFTRNSGQKKNLKFIAWLQWLGSVGSNQSPLVQAMIQQPDGRKEVRSLYREIAAASVNGTKNFWESVFADRVNACARLMKSDLRLLQTTANGLGISPVPVGRSELEIPCTPPPPADSEQSRSPVTEIDQPITLQLPLDYRPPVEEEPSVVRRSIDNDIELLKDRLEIVESIRPSLQEVEELRQRVDVLESAQSALVAEFHAFKQERSRKKSSPPLVPRDDPLPVTVDDKIEAVFKKLAECS